MLRQPFFASLLEENLTFYQTPEGIPVIVGGDVSDDFFDANYDSYEDYLKQKK